MSFDPFFVVPTVLLMLAAFVLGGLVGEALHFGMRHRKKFVSVPAELTAEGSESAAPARSTLQAGAITAVGAPSQEHQPPLERPSAGAVSGSAEGAASAIAGSADAPKPKRLRKRKTAEASPNGPLPEADEGPRTPANRAGSEEGGY